MKKTVWLLIGFLTVKLTLQYVLINPAYDLHRDEYLHLDQGRHLAWGYISVPPMTSWISYLIDLAGGSVFWVKLVPAVFGALTMFVVYKIIEVLNGKLFAAVLGTLAVLLSAILRINILYQPNSSDIFLWTLAYFTIIKYVATGQSKWLYLAAAAVGFGMLSKYNIIFLAVALFAGLLLTRERKIFRNKNVYTAALVTLVIILPNVLWQISNHFPTFGQLSELSRKQLVNVKRLDFVKDQVLYFVNSFFVILAAFAGFMFYEPFRKYRFIFLSYIIAIGVYIFLKAKSYYAVGLYPVLLAFGSVYLETLLKEGWRQYLRPVAFVFVIGLFIPLLFAAFPIKGPAAIEKDNAFYKRLGLLKWEDGRDHSLPQDFADMIGWSELAGKVDAVYSELPDKGSTLVYCDNYGEAGAVNYYSKYRNIHAVSMNADYINWFPLETEIKNIILVKDAGDSDPERTKEKPLFDSVSLIARNDNPYSRELGTKIFLLKGAKVNVNRLLEKEIDERKRMR